MLEGLAHKFCMLIGVDLFAGAGGLSLGARMAGISVVLAVEINRAAIATYRHNHPETMVIEGDVRGVQKFPVERGDDDVVLFGGPPCRGFSTSNQRTRNERNPDNHLYLEFLRAVRQIQPEWVVFENVAGLLETDRRPFLDHTLEELDRAGYSVAYNVLNSADYGVPQRRSRLFVVASRVHRTAVFPAPLPGPTPTVWDAIGDLPQLTIGTSVSRMPYRGPPPSSYAATLRGCSEHAENHLVSRNAPYVVERYRHIKPGGNWKDIPVSMMSNYANVKRCHTGIYRRLKWDEPSIVIGNYRKNMLIHPDQDRGLSVREAARLQSFPDSFEFKGSIGLQQQQVGNAVPPMLAGAVFKEIKDSYRLVTSAGQHSDDPRR